MQISEILEMWLVRRQNQSPQHVQKIRFPDHTLVSARSGDSTGATILFSYIYLQIPLHCQREAGKSINVNERDAALHDLQLVYYMLSQLFSKYFSIRFGKERKRAVLSQPFGTMQTAVQPKMQGSTLWGSYADNDI